MLYGLYGSGDIVVQYRHCTSVNDIQHTEPVEVLLYATGTEALLSLYGP